MSDWNTTSGWSSGLQGALGGAQGGFAAAGPIGGLIGGLAGGITGLFGHKKSTDWNKKYFNESVRQFNIQDDFNKNATQYRVRDALKAGINPLAALGISSNVSPTLSSGGYVSESSGSTGVGDFISGLSRIFSKQEKESRDLDLEAKRIRNQQMKSELDIMRQPGLPSNGNSAFSSSVVQPIGTDSQLFRVVYDLNGDPRLMVNQDVTENDADNAGYKSSMLTALANGFINPVSGHIRSNQYRMMLDDMHYRATGRHISNLERLYVSPTELAIVGVDSVRGSR